MKSTRIAINGLGRVGKLLLRDFADKGMLDQVVLLNDAAGTLEEHAHLLEFDTVHGRWGTDIQVTENGLCINGVNIALSRQSDISSLPLAEAGVELLIDCTGRYRDRCEHFKWVGWSKVWYSTANNCWFDYSDSVINYSCVTQPSMVHVFVGVLCDGGAGCVRHRRLWLSVD